MAEHSSCLGEAQAECVVQPGGEPLHMGADLTGGRPKGIRGLLGVSSLDALVTAPTAPDADGEARDDRSHLGQLGMELIPTIVTLVVNHVATIGARRRQRGGEFVVDGSDRGHPMAVAPMVLAGLAARRCGLLFGKSLRERRGLTFARTPCRLPVLRDHPVASNMGPLRAHTDRPG